MPTPDALSLFLPPVQEWFRRTLGRPTPVQVQGWPPIAAGQNTLLLAPTGSGKTLAAFLACLNGLWQQDPLPRGLRILYVSPLKALNNDIYRNLQIPLEGVAQVARELDFPLPSLEVAIRTGDTPPQERQRLVRRPPHVLITTPESLHLLLTSRARETLRGITHCIIDEIHALCPNKRGVFLSLLLERLEAINPSSFVRIGLSATQRPLDEVARYLGGQILDDQGKPQQRPVTIVDAGLRKNLDLQVLSPVEQFGAVPEKTIWPSIYRLLAEQISRHRSTIIFANNRRTVERLTVQLQDFLETINPTDETPLVRAHHGSVALEVRQDTERALKEGRLQAVVATASLELGIDMGAVDLVCQVESTGNVARALQRVGRAGHLVGQESKGRLIPKTIADLLDQAVLAAEMTAGRVEEMRVPLNCLDVLAQQIVAMVAMERWPVPELYRRLRQAYPFRDLTPRAFDAVLEMVTGRFQFTAPSGDADDDKPTNPGTSLAALQPRISWDRVHNRLEPLPGTHRLALLNGGTIPDTGQFAVVTHKGQRIGEVDEEFIFERRIGDAFLLGTNAWRIDDIGVDRVTVLPAEGAPAMVPFWRGEGTGRSFDLGEAQGRFLRTLEAKLDAPDCLEWLQSEHHLDPAAARNVRHYVLRQKLRTGFVPSDRTLGLEASRDPLGDWQVVLLSPWGNRIHLTLRLALENRLRERLGYGPQCLHHDDGILVRLTESEEPLLDLFEGVTPDNLQTLVLEELADSALFALRFRQNAARAMLMPRGQANKRAPLWLQRMRGRDLLQVARRFPDFPIVAETFRECLHDHLDLPRARELLTAVRSGAIELRTCRLEIASPFAAGLLFGFQMATMYQYDGVEAEPGRGLARLDQELLDQLVGSEGRHLALDPRAVHQVERRLRGVGQPPRSAAEMAEWLRRLGDAAPSDLEGPMAEFVRELEADGRVERLELPRVAEPRRWVLHEEAELYRSVFTQKEQASEGQQRAGERILIRYLETHAMVGLQDILARYPFDPTWARRRLEDWARTGRLIKVEPSQTPQAADVSEGPHWSALANFQHMQRSTLAVLRREVVSCPAPQFADFVLTWHKVHPQHRSQGDAALAEVLERLQGCFLPAELWENAVLPARLAKYDKRLLDELLATGEWLWVGHGEEERGPASVAFLSRETFLEMSYPPREGSLTDETTATVLSTLRQRGALFLPDLAQETGLFPSLVRAALWSLVRLGLVTNDRFDVVRRGEEKPIEVPQAAAVPMRTARPGLAARNRPRTGPRPEGRWSVLPWASPDMEIQAVLAARVLLERYGIVARELALLDERLPPWRVLYEVLSRLELAGDVRRGYFVEGLSGAQFALPEAIRRLQDLGAPSQAQAPLILLHSLDPANIYGSGAPLDIPLLDGGTRPFLRRLGNWLVLQAGRPVLLIEQQAKRLTALASARREDVAAAVLLLPGILGKSQLRDIKHKLVVETWNEQPVTSTAGKDMLEAAGFVRDYQAMAWYAVWH